MERGGNKRIEERSNGGEVREVKRRGVDEERIECRGEREERNGKMRR